MTVENTAPSSEALEPSTIEADGAEGVSTAEDLEDDSGGIEDAPVESFEDWLAKQDGKTEPKEKEAAPAEEEAPPKEETKPAKIKVKDKEYSPEELEKTLLEADQARADYTKIHKQAEQLIDVLKTDPGKVLDQLEVNKDVIDQWYYKKYIEPDILTPEQRQAKADQEELARLRQKDQEETQRQETQRQEQLRKQYQQEWANRITSALDSAGLPKSELVVSRMAYHMKQALSSGKQNVQPTDVVDLVRQDLIELQKSTISSLPPDKLQEVLGEEALTKLRKHEADKYKQTKFENKNPPKPGKPRDTKKKSTKKYSSPYDLLDDL